MIKGNTQKKMKKNKNKKKRKIDPHDAVYNATMALSEIALT